MSMMRNLKWALGWSKEASEGQLIWPGDKGVYDLNRCIKITADIDVGSGSALFISGNKIHAWQQAVRMQYNQTSRLWEIYISKKYTIETEGDINQFKFLVGPYDAGTNGIAPVDQLRFQDGDNRTLEAADYHLERAEFPNYFRVYAL